MIRPYEPLAWMGEANCATTDPELFFPKSGDSLAPARRICAHCPVTAECLTYALAEGVQDGIWAGKTLRQRRDMKRRKKAA